MRREALDDRSFGGVVGSGGEVRASRLVRHDADVRLDDVLTDLDGDAPRESGKRREAAAVRAQAGQSSRTLARRSFRSKGLVMTSLMRRSPNWRWKFTLAAVTKSTGISRTCWSARMRS